jgi:hypothetical protein
MTAMAGRGTGGHEGLDGDDSALERFQKREREMAGTAMGGGVLRPLERCRRISAGEDQSDVPNDAPGIGNKMRRISGARAHRWLLIRRILGGSAAGSGDKFRCPGGTICRGMKGEMERRCGATYRRGAGTKRAGINQEFNRERGVTAGSRRRDHRPEVGDDRIS